jgi:hypothetical protein
MKELAKTAEQDKPVSKKSGHAEAEVLFFQPFAEIALTYCYHVSNKNFRL